VNYVPYLYKYEGIIPLLFTNTNNSKINDTESKRDSYFGLLIKFNEAIQ